MSARVLILDDSLTVRMDLQEALAAARFEVVATGTAEEFWRAIAEAPPALVILDVVLPDADGLEVLKALKGRPETAAVPVLLLSTESEVRNRLKGLATGAEDYVGKPYDRRYVVERARELVGSGAATQPAQNRPLVLVVEDSRTYREELREALEAEGYAVALAGSGEEGLHLAAMQRPEAMIVDGGLPGIDGVTVVRRIRLDPALRRVPCMFLTASENREDELAALEAGADAYLRKRQDIPFIIARLGAMLRAVGAPEVIRLDPATSGPARRLLLVRMDRALDEALFGELTGEGYDLVMAETTTEAMALLGAQAVDGILLDGAMPDPTGLAFCREVKDSAATRDLPLLVLSEGGTPRDMITTLEAGADDFIVATRDYEVIKGRVRALLRRKHFEEENRRIHETLLHQQVELAEARAARELAETRAALSAENERLQREKVEALKEADRLKDQFLSILSHELRTPLNALVGFGSMLEDEEPGPLNEQQHYFLRKMLAGADVLLSLVNDLLDMSRIQAGKFQLSPEPMRFRATTQEVIATLAPLAEQKRHQLVNEVPPDLPELLADPQRIGQVLVNLINNAIKFTPAGGTIWVRARIAGKCLRCEVEDTGPGIPEDDLERLFQPFTQLDMSSTRTAGGTGLGLSISKALVGAHGGEIGVHSHLGEGALFWFSVPLTARVEPAAR